MFRDGQVRGAPYALVGVRVYSWRSGRYTWLTRRRRRHLTPTAIGPFWRFLGLARGKGHRGEETQTESAERIGGQICGVAASKRSERKIKGANKTTKCRDLTNLMRSAGPKCTIPNTVQSSLLKIDFNLGHPL